MLTQEDDVDAHALRKRGWTITAIAAHLGHDRKTIRAYLNGRTGLSGILCEWRGLSVRGWKGRGGKDHIHGFEKN